jgi:hypothetical protein
MPFVPPSHQLSFADDPGAHKNHRKRRGIYPLSEADILRRLERAQELLRLPGDVWTVIQEVIAPDEEEAGDQADAARPAPEPTTHLPGTADKIAVLAARVRRGEDLHHPADTDWTDPEAAHTEQIGQVLRNGAIKRTKCKVAHRDGASVMIPRDPEGAAEELRRQFRFGELRELAGLLWEGVGYHPKKPRHPEEGFLLAGKLERRRRKKKGPPAPSPQLTLWPTEDAA